MTSRLQTVEVMLPNATKVLQSLEWLPVCPLPLDETDKTKPRRIIKEDGTVITWVDNEHVRMELPDGTHKYFPCKPTISEAVHLSPFGGSPSYYKFNKDGSVEYSNLKDGNYYWGPDTERPAEVGVEETPHKCLDDVWDFYNDCQGYCDYAKEQEQDKECNCPRCYSHDYDYPDDDALGGEGYGGDW